MTERSARLLVVDDDPAKRHAIAHTLRHAAAGHVCVVVKRRERDLAVTVEDDGGGFDPARTDPTRLGLAGMRERAELLGRSFEVESAPGKGTAVYARLPLPERVR
jgi:signal transduction histidine kinase